MSNKALVWLRDDFRINNNDALTYATNNHDLVTAVFIFNNNIFDNKREAQKWWLSKSLESFRSDLKKFNIGLEIIKDDEINFFSKLKSNNKISVYWNKVYEPAEFDKDKKILKDFTDNYGGGLLSRYYKDSPIKFLESVFPEKNWLPWKFEVSSNNTWKNKDGTFNMTNHNLYAEYLGRKKGFKEPEDWYEVTQKDFTDNYGGGILHAYYNGSPLEFVTNVYPDYPWDRSKFKKN